MAHIPFSQLHSINLYVLGSEDNINDAHVDVIHQEPFRNNNPYPYGIYDPHMGTTDNSWNCETCKNRKVLCPGHPGVVKLNYPVLSPMFIKEIMKWLRIICFECGKLIVPYQTMSVKKSKILGEFVKLTRTQAKNRRCPHCGSIHLHVTQDKNDNITIYKEAYDETSTSRTAVSEIKQFYPHEIQETLNKISEETLTKMGKPIECHPKKFVLNAIRAPPNTIRPDIKKLGGGRSNNNDLTVLLQYIVKINDKLPRNIPTDIKTLDADIHNLNLAVYELIKGSSESKRGLRNNSSKPLTSIAKRLPRKYGRIRRNLLGRRANYMARSTITCDVRLRQDEVGLPVSVAKNIQRPEVVREYNYDQMMIYFMNGTQRYPGCTKIKKASTGRVHWVGRINENLKLEIGDIIYRDTIDGDVVNFNRQPSLEPSSISAHKTVIMHQWETIRINVLVCPLYNADFDGDEMNVLFTRSNRTSNEIMRLSSPAQKFISYKNGSPKMGEAQDSLIGTAELTKSENKFNREHVMQLFDQTSVIPDLNKMQQKIEKLKNKSLNVFSGRDIVSILFWEMNHLINYTGKPKFYDSNLDAFMKYNPEDIKVEIDRGYLKHGVLDKNSVGEGAQGGIFHIIHNKYGSEDAIASSHNIQQLALAFLMTRGYTVSIGDFLVKDEFLDKIRVVENTLIAESLEITNRLNEGKMIPPIDKTLEEFYEENQINALKPETEDSIWEYILGGIYPDYNNLFKLIIHGSKGKSFNFINISSAIGQQEINGERMAENFGGRSFAYFTKYDSDPASRGYVANSYISGSTVTEFLFIAQTGRYSLIQKALSTSVTGEQNRKSIKNLETLISDNQRKVSKNGKIIQLLYGGDGCDPRYIERVKFPTTSPSLGYNEFKKQYHSNSKSFDKKFNNAQVQKLLDKEFQQLEDDRNWYREQFIKLERINNTKMFNDVATMPVNIGRIIEDTIFNLELRNQKTQKINPVTAIEKVNKLCYNIVYRLINEIQEKKQATIPTYMNNTTKLLQILIRSYLCTSMLLKNGITDYALDVIIKHIRLTYSNALVAYGSAVGIIAAQSISEPMTQMVLDSHHYSGAASTKKRGMFRIRELLGARPTEKMKAPSMYLNVLPEYQHDKIKVREIANHIEMLELKRFTSKMQIFFEKYGEPIHPDYKHESKLIKEFEKYNVNIKPPSDLANWCIRIVLNKPQLIIKQMKMETIYHKIRVQFPMTHIIYSTDNADSIIMRIYVRNIIAKKSQITVNQMNELANDILNTVVRGISGINAAYVHPATRTVLQKDGTAKKEKYFQIFTNGTNLEEILENPYIESESATSDSIIEIYNTYGIEAARSKIIDELYIQVSAASYRHYTIYADEMTFTGMVTSVDRYGSAKRDSSIMLRISDSNPIAVIEESAVNASEDNLKGVSPPIMNGKNPRIGDLYNSFKIDEEFVKQNVENLEDILEDL